MFPKFIEISLALVIVIVSGACQNMTEENSTGLPTKQPVAVDHAAPKCECPTAGTHCRIEAVGKSLKCQKFVGGCVAGTSVCNVDEKSTTTAPCDDTDASTSENWIDTKGTSASSWTLWASGRFECKLSQSQSCTVAGCNADFVCNAATGKCEAVSSEFFVCKTKSCLANSEECYCDNGHAVCYERQGLCYTKNGSEVCAAKEGVPSVQTNCVSGTTCQAGKCVASGNQSACAPLGCPAGQLCNEKIGQCYTTGGGTSTPGYDHTFCAWASVTAAKGAYGGQTNTLNATSTKDWTDMLDPKEQGGWYTVVSGGQTKFCRGVTSLARGIRVLIKTADGDFPGWVQTTSGKQYQLPFTIYGSWDGSNLMSVTPSSQNCIDGEVNKATCQLNKDSLNNTYGAVFPSPWQP